MTEDHPNVYRVETKTSSCLDIEVQRADVVLRGADTDDLVASLKPGRRERGQLVGLDVHQEGDTILIRSIDNQKLSRQTLTVEIPSALQTIRARMSQGDLRVSGLAEVDLNLCVEKGDARLTELSGRIHLEAGNGDIKARTLAGRIELSAGSGDVKISEARGEWIKLNTGHGDVVIERVTGNTLCTLGRGDIVAMSLGGEAEITSGAGDIVLSAMDALKAQVSTGAGDILVHKGSLRELSASTRRGDITLQADLLEGQFDLTSKSGDVKVVLQPDANVRFEAATARGDLVSDVPGVKVGRPGPASRAGGRLVGVIGDGHAELSLHTSSGDVRIRVLSSLTRVRESATQAWGEALRAVEIRSHGQEEHEWDREHPCSQPRSNTEGAEARETTSLDREHPCSQPLPNVEGAEDQEIVGEPAASAGQGAPEEEATALRILEALQASEIDVDEAERLLAQL
ncbi:MAG: DUF4097 family beta strand repeat-containing protein [Chloroflexota bacterium]